MMQQPLSPNMMVAPFNAAANSNSLDPFASTAPAKQQNLTNTQQMTTNMENLDPFNHVQPPADLPAQASLDPFGMQAPPPSQPVLNPFAAHEPANSTSVGEQLRDNEECNFDDLDSLDELDRAEALAARLVQHERENGMEYEDDNSEEEGDAEDWSKDDDSDEYDCVFEERDQKLGVLILDVNKHGTNVVMAKMIVDHSAAMREGVMEGSQLISINGTSVEGKMHKDCTAMIRSVGRPLTLRFRKPNERDEMAKGFILARVVAGETTGSGGIGFVSNWKKGVATWSDRYYVWSGCNEEELHIYRNEQDHQQYTVQAHEAKKGGADPVVKVDKFNMTREWMKHNPYQVTHIKCKEYKSYGMLFYFSLKVKPNGDFPVWMVAGKFASQDKQEIDRLHESIRHTIRMNKR